MNEVHIPETIKVYPLLNAAFLEHDLIQVGRIYLLARAIDPVGSGRIEADRLRQMFTNPYSSPKYLFTWKRLRQIITAGEGVTWDVVRKHGHPHRLYLHGVYKVAKNLGCDRLQRGDLVEFPTAALLDGIQEARVHFCTSFYNEQDE